MSDRGICCVIYLQSNISIRNICSFQTTTTFIEVCRLLHVHDVSHTSLSRQGPLPYHCWMFSNIRPQQGGAKYHVHRDYLLRWFVLFVRESVCYVCLIWDLQYAIYDLQSYFQNYHSCCDLFWPCHLSCLCCIVHSNTSCLTSCLSKSNRNSMSQFMASHMHSAHAVCQEIRTTKPLPSSKS